MSMGRILLAAALACGAPAAAAAAQALPGDSAWMNLVTIMRLRDEFAARPAEASFLSHPTQPWANVDWPVDLPEPFHSRAFVARSYVLLDVDSAGHAAGCRPLRAGEYAELDALACTLLMRPGYFTVTPVPTRESFAGQWVMGLRWESLTAAAYRQRPRMEGTVAAVPPSQRPPSPQPIQIGQTVRGRLESGDRVTSNGRFYDDYTFTAPSAMRLRITMRSRELGACLHPQRHPPGAGRGLPCGGALRLQRSEGCWPRTGRAAGTAASPA